LKSAIACDRFAVALSTGKQFHKKLDTSIRLGGVPTGEDRLCGDRLLGDRRDKILVNFSNGAIPLFDNGIDYRP
jgi:hypothetical protein